MLCNGDGKRVLAGSTCFTDDASEQMSLLQFDGGSGKLLDVHYWPAWFGGLIAWTSKSM